MSNFIGLSHFTLESPSPGRLGKKPAFALQVLRQIRPQVGGYEHSQPSALVLNLILTTFRGLFLFLDGQSERDAHSLSDGTIEGDRSPQHLDALPQGRETGALGVRGLEGIA